MYVWSFVHNLVNSLLIFSMFQKTFWGQYPRICTFSHVWCIIFYFSMNDLITISELEPPKIVCYASDSDTALSYIVSGPSPRNLLSRATKQNFLWCILIRKKWVFRRCVIAATNITDDEVTFIKLFQSRIMFTAC